MGLHVNGYDLAEYRDHYRFFWGVRRPRVPKTTRIITFLNDIIFNISVPLVSGNLYHQTYYNNLAPTFRGKKILTVHDMIHELYPEFFKAGKSVTKIKREAVKRADGIICISQSTKNDLIRLFDCPDHKIKVIYHGNSLKIAVTSPPAVNVPYILYVGQRGEHKNFNLLFDAYAHAERINSEYALVCFGGEPFDRQERWKISDFKLSQKMIHCSGDDVFLANLYKYASVLVYPSLYEGFGIPPLEAMHYGCPVLTSNSSSLPEVVGDAGIYFNPKDMDNLMSQLEDILTESDLRSRCVQKGFQREGMFSWDRCADETLAYYQELLS